MSRICVLDAGTIDQIAAGEVVERPASVVKELLENAIDADATAITCEIKGGGIDYIRITDNGSGIQKDEIQTAFLRHATSKISSAEDLLTVHSLGFRGEALSSISAVSKVELMTKTKAELCGYRYVTEGGREMVLEACGIPDGTTFIVRNLFFNVPARRKFLKSTVTESSSIAELMEHLMLSHPEISFKFIVNGKVKLQTAGDGQVENVIYQLYGRDVLKLMVPIEMAGDDFTLRGYVGRPEMTRGNRNYEIFFVNGRNIRSTLLNRALDEAYQPYLMLHQYPYAILYLNIDAQLLDVNVHPTKMEVRFLNGEQIYQALVAAVREGLKRRELIPVSQEPATPTPAVPTADEILPEPFETKARELFLQKPALSVFEQPIFRVNDATAEADAPVSVPESGYAQQSFLTEEARARHQLIGQLFDTYWLVEHGAKLYVIDQHAAHEKIRYEHLLSQYRSGKQDVQMMNPPIIMSLTLREMEILETYNDIFRAAGFEIESFGGSEYALYGVPTELYGLKEADYFVELLDTLSDSAGKADSERVLAHLASVSCKGAVKAGMKLSDAEANEMIDALLRLENPFHCPHGRPIIVSMTKTELEKKFKRIV